MISVIRLQFPSFNLQPAYRSYIFFLFFFLITVIRKVYFVAPIPQVAVPDLVEAAKNADILIFVVPHQFIPNFCKQLLGKIKPNAIAISLIKGFDKAEGGGIDLISHIITRHLKASQRRKGDTARISNPLVTFHRRSHAPC